MTPDEVLSRKQDFVSATNLGPIDVDSHYWILQSLRSELEHDREYRLDGPWLSVRTFVVNQDGSVLPLKQAGFGFGYSPLSDIDPSLEGSAKVASREALFTLKSGEPLLLLSQVQSLPTFTRSFVPRVVDHAKFLEVRRFGLYIEGCLLGILFALGVFGWY